MANILSTVDNCGVGYLYTTGYGEYGQLGFSAEEAQVPTLVGALSNVKIKQSVCGGLQTFVLTENGQVFSFGLNDDGTLGRNLTDDDNEEAFSCTPGQVELPHACMQLSAGDSHCAALLENGHVYAWGNFKISEETSHGVDFRKDEEMTRNPTIISQELPAKVIKISSGAHHLVMLCQNGFVYTLGDGSGGQLGRKLPDKFRGNVVKHLLQPASVSLVKSGQYQKGINIWTGEYTTFVQCNNSFWVFGANNWNQCGMPSSRVAQSQIVAYPSDKSELAGKKWKSISGGYQHTLALDVNGTLYSLGRNTEGQCGVGTVENECVERPTVVAALQHNNIRKVATGSRTSFAITETGELLGWGVGEYIGLGESMETDQLEEYHFRPVQLNKSEEMKVLDVDGGGLHSAMIFARNNEFISGMDTD